MERGLRLSRSDLISDDLYKLFDEIQLWWICASDPTELMGWTVQQLDNSVMVVKRLQVRKLFPIGSQSDRSIMRRASAVTISFRTKMHRNSNKVAIYLSL
jgi:hypothetical protein